MALSLRGHPRKLPLLDPLLIASQATSVRVWSRQVLFFPALLVLFPSQPLEARASFSHCSRPLHLHLTCFSVDALPSHPFTVTVCPGLPTWVHPL